MTLNELSFLDKYPRTKHFIETHPGVALDTALMLTEIEIKKLEKG